LVLRQYAIHLTFPYREQMPEVAVFYGQYAAMWHRIGVKSTIARMSKTKDVVDTTLRLPRDLHAMLKDCAARGGITLSAEIIFRLQHDPRDGYAEEILDEMRARDVSVEAGLRRAATALWGALDRAADTLAHVEGAMALVPPDGAAADLKREVVFARELIKALDALR
jgi:hypothetical protein